MKKNMKIGFLGAGNMAEALMKGLIQSKLLSPTNAIASDISLKRRKYISSTLKVKTSENNKDVVKHSEIVFIAVKPNVVELLLTEVGQFISSKQLVISIAAGITTSKIEKYLVANVPVVRVMPNTPAIVLSGASALAGGKAAKKAHIDLAVTLLNSRKALKSW